MSTASKVSCSKGTPYKLEVSEHSGELYWDYTGIALPSRSNAGVIEVEVFEQWFDYAEVLCGGASFYLMKTEPGDIYNGETLSPAIYLLGREGLLYWAFTGKRVTMSGGKFLLCGCVSGASEFATMLQDPYSLKELESEQASKMLLLWSWLVGCVVAYFVLGPLALIAPLVYLVVKPRVAKRLKKQARNAFRPFKSKWSLK